MAQPKVPTGAELKRLRDRAAEARLRATQTQLSMAFTYCTVGENEILFGDHGVARELVERVRQTTESMRSHIGKQRDLPSNSLAEVRNQLRQLENRVMKIGTQFTSKP